ERRSAEAAAGPDSIGAAGSSQLATAAGATRPGAPSSSAATAATSGSASSTCSTLSSSSSSSLLPGVGEQHSHAGQHLQLCPAEAVYSCPEPRGSRLRHSVLWLLRVQPVLPPRGSRLRHSVLWLLRVQPVLPPLSSLLTQALQQGHRAPLHQGQQRGVSQFSFLPSSASTLPQLQQPVVSIRSRLPSSPTSSSSAHLHVSGQLHVLSIFLHPSISSL
ncbi:hypothetical protein LDENG_00141120, partial [Lucifuga dentata]